MIDDVRLLALAFFIGTLLASGIWAIFVFLVGLPPPRPPPRKERDPARHEFYRQLYGYGTSKRLSD